MISCVGPMNDSAARCHGSGRTRRLADRHRVLERWFFHWRRVHVGPGRRRRGHITRRHDGVWREVVRKELRLENGGH